MFAFGNNRIFIIQVIEEKLCTNNRQFSSNKLLRLKYTFCRTKQKPAAANNLIIHKHLKTLSATYSCNDGKLHAPALPLSTHLTIPFCWREKKRMKTLLLVLLCRRHLWFFYFDRELSPESTKEKSENKVVNKSLIKCTSSSIQMITFYIHIEWEWEGESVRERERDDKRATCILHWDISCYVNCSPSSWLSIVKYTKLLTCHLKMLNMMLPPSKKKPTKILGYSWRIPSNPLPHLPPFTTKISKLHWKWKKWK